VQKYKTHFAGFSKDLQEFCTSAPLQSQKLCKIGNLLANEFDKFCQDVSVSNLINFWQMSAKVWPNFDRCVFGICWQRAAIVIFFYLLFHIFDSFFCFKCSKIEYDDIMICYMNSIIYVAVFPHISIVVPFQNSDFVACQSAGKPSAKVSCSWVSHAPLELAYGWRCRRGKRNITFKCNADVCNFAKQLALRKGVHCTPVSRILMLPQGYPAIFSSNRSSFSTTYF
jgi:hypothetical protein